MSVNIPILDDGTPVNQLGSEFNMYQNDQRDRGLISPPMKDEEYSKSNTSVSVNPSGELYNQQIIFENNHNPNGIIRYTDAQSLQKLIDSGSLGRQKSEIEKQLELSEDFDLDPELRQKLLTESLMDGGDIFHVKSKDYVDEVQESVRQFNKERNLYLQKALGGSQGKPKPAELLKAGGVGDVEDILELLGVPPTLKEREALKQRGDMAKKTLDVMEKKGIEISKGAREQLYKDLLKARAEGDL